MNKTKVQNGKVIMHPNMNGLFWHAFDKDGKCIFCGGTDT